MATSKPKKTKSYQEVGRDSICYVLLGSESHRKLSVSEGKDRVNVSGEAPGAGSSGSASATVVSLDEEEEDCTIRLWFIGLVATFRWNQKTQCRKFIMSGQDFKTWCRRSFTLEQNFSDIIKISISCLLADIDRLPKFIVRRFALFVCQALIFSCWWFVGF